MTPSCRRGDGRGVVRGCRAHRVDGSWQTAEKPCETSPSEELNRDRSFSIATIMELVLSSAERYVRV